MRYRTKSNLLESAFRSSAVVGFLLLYSSQFLPQGLSFQNAFLYNFTELQRTFFSSKVLFGSFVGNFPKGSKKLANLNGLCKQSFLQNTVWTVNDVLVDPYPFFWSIHTLFTALKGYGTTKTKKSMDRPRHHWRSKLYVLHIHINLRKKVEGKINGLISIVSYILNKHPLYQEFAKTLFLFNELNEFSWLASCWEASRERASPIV